jgi:hypothetical protein
MDLSFHWYAQVQFHFGMYSGATASQLELPNSVELLTSFNQLADLLQPNYAELTELKQTGHSLRSTIKELYKLLLIELIKSQLTWIDFTAADYSHEQILSQLHSLDEIQKAYILAGINQDLENWRQGNFDGRLQQIHQQLYHYFQSDQISSQVGEKGLFALDKIGLDASDIAVAAELVDRGGVRQRIFNYQITSEQLPDLIASAHNFAQITGHVRELVEARNLEALYRLSESAEFGDTIIERSLPVHNWQTDCMWRMFRKTFRLKQNGAPGELEECWDITIISLPPDEQQVEIYPHLISAACLEASPLVVETVSEAEFKLLEAKVDPLAQLLLVPASNALDVVAIANQIPAVSRLGGFELLSEVDSRVTTQVQQVMKQLAPVSQLIVNAIPSITTEDDLQSLTNLYQQSVAAALLPFMPKQRLKNLSTDAQALIDSGQLFDLVIQGEIDLNTYIAEHTDGEGIELDGECGVMQIGADSWLGQQIDFSIAPVTSSKDGVELVWLQTQSGNKVLAKCPNPRCSHKNLDPCLANCPQCGIDTQQMRLSYETGNGAFHNYVKSYNESKGMKSTATTQGVDHFFNSLFNGISSLFTWIFV